MQYPKRSQYKHAKKKKYRIRIWRAYTEALRRQGDLTVWFDVDAIEEWQADKNRQAGRPEEIRRRGHRNGLGCSNDLQACLPSNAGLAEFDCHTRSDGTDARLGVSRF